MPQLHFSYDKNCRCQFGINFCDNQFGIYHRYSAKKELFFIFLARRTVREKIITLQENVPKIIAKTVEIMEGKFFAAEKAKMHN